MSRRATNGIGSIVVALALMAAGCIPTPEERKPLVKRQGAVALKCDEAQVVVTHVGHRLFEASGCGRQVMYQVNCHLGVSSCYLIARTPAGPQE